MHELKHVILQAGKLYYSKKFVIVVYIQFGFIDELCVVDTVVLKDREALFVDKFQAIKSIFDTQCRWLGLYPALKHNLPDATIIIDCSKAKEELRLDIGRNTKDKIKKAERSIISGQFVVSSSWLGSHADLFYSLYTTTADMKWFGAVTLEMRNNLIQDALVADYGRLFIIKKADGSLVSGVLCVQVDDTLVYLYWANDRSVGNIWLSHYLHRYIIQFAQEAGLRMYDMLGASRLGSQNDRLEKVTQFKLWFGWKKVEYGGSWDLILNRVLYKLYALL